MTVAVLSTAAGAFGQVAVRGTLADQTVDTTVDSTAAAYYLSHHVEKGAPGRGPDPELDAELRALAGEPGDRDFLRRLTESHSTDLATLYFVARTFESPDSRAAQLAFHRYTATLASRGDGESAVHVPQPRRGSVMAFVPGYAYRRDRDTGADFARQRTLMTEKGFANVLIETDDLGDVEDNATVVRRELVRLAGEYDEIVLISASKGGAEAALALGEELPAAARGAVKAWISVGGLLRGSPYADRARRWPRSWVAGAAFAIRGLRSGVIENLSTQVRLPVFERLRFPSDLLTLQYVGVPLSGHIGRETRGRYDALKHLGPNDALTLLADELVPGGLVVTDLGLDHYYRDPQIDAKTLALTYVVLDELERRSSR